MSETYDYDPDPEDYVPPHRWKKVTAMNITVEIKNTYGQDKIYPVCDKAKIFAQIAGTTTLLRRNIQLIQALGYEVNIKQQEMKL